MNKDDPALFGGGIIFIVSYSWFQGRVIYKANIYINCSIRDALQMGSSTVLPNVIVVIKGRLIFIFSIPEVKSLYAAQFII